MIAFITAHFTALVLIVLGVVAVLFILLRTDPKSRKALRQELWLVRTVISWFRPSVLPKPGEPDPLADTSMPFTAVPDPRASGEKKP